MTVNLIYEKDENGYYVCCPQLKGCHSQGDTFEEARDNIREAIELYLETISPDEVTELLGQEVITSTIT